MIPTSVIYRTFQIKYKKSIGTSFVLDYNKRQYFVTAKHVVKELADDEKIEIFKDKKWTKFAIKLVGHSLYSDISVFVVPDAHINGENLAATSNEIYYSQEIFFLGYPYGIQNFIKNINNGFPMPFVKRGILSNLLIEEERKILFLDGINNPGFSGGPVVYYNKKNKRLELCGIISGFRFEKQNATISDQKTDIQIKTNSGIIISYGIEAAIELIKRKPIGRKT